MLSNYTRMTGPIGHFCLNGALQILVSATLRLVTLIAFYSIPLSISQTVWISDFFLPASLMIFFAFLGSLWSVIGVTIGSFVFISLYRSMPWDIVLTTSLPSSFALLFAMSYLYITLHEEIRPALPIRLTFKRIVIVSTVYAFFNALFFYMAFLIHFEYFKNYIEFYFMSLLHLFLGDILGGVLVLWTLKLIVQFLVRLNSKQEAQ